MSSNWEYIWLIKITNISFLSWVNVYRSTKIRTREMLMKFLFFISRHVTRCVSTITKRETSLAFNSGVCILSCTYLILVAGRTFDVCRSISRLIPSKLIFWWNLRYWKWFGKLLIKLEKSHLCLTVFGQDMTLFCLHYKALFNLFRTP